MVSERDMGILLKIIEEISYLTKTTTHLNQEKFLKSENYKRIATMTLINIG